MENTDEEWKKKLTPEEYRILRKKGTEAPFSGVYCDFKGVGEYDCAACGNPLFTSKAKYDSMSGWPSFWEPISENAVSFSEDYHVGYKRVEVLCAKCHSHLGHVFDDGPPPTGKRYCMNSASMKFHPEK